MAVPSVVPFGQPLGVTIATVIKSKSPLFKIPMWFILNVKIPMLHHNVTINRVYFPRKFTAAFECGTRKEILKEISSMKSSITTTSDTCVKQQIKKKLAKQNCLAMSVCEVIVRHKGF